MIGCAENEKICYCIGAGDFGCGSLVPGPEDLVIACDGGWSACLERGIHADVLLGDFDSLGADPETMPAWEEERPEIIRLPVCKDVTDTWAAAEVGRERGYRNFAIFGGTGGRLSHTMANIQLLAHLAEEGMHAVMYAESGRITAVSCGKLTFPAGGNEHVSVFALSERAEGVTIRGMAYELEDGTLTADYPLGVSNSLIGKDAEISVKRGTLLVIAEERQ